MGKFSMGSHAVGVAETAMLLFFVLRHLTTTTTSQQPQQPTSTTNLNNQPLSISLFCSFFFVIYLYAWHEHAKNGC